MTILALEFSSAQRSVALARDGVVLAEAGEAGGRDTKAFALIEKVLAQAKVSRAEIAVIAVGLGPGSYTGIRAAIAVAQGWQLAGDAKLLGISSVEALAAEAQARNIFGRVNVVVDAQRGEFYRATWEISAVSRAEISPLKIVTAAELAALNIGGDICVGPDAGTVLWPAAARLAELATRRTDFVAGETLQPVYLRETSFVKATPSRRF
jgi:tRNA threonylcarbamoyladenosine biosynthesis protein TsaB